MNDEWGGELGALVNYYSSNGVYGGSGVDNNGNVLKSQTIVNSFSIEDRYNYDALNRLTSVSEYQNGTTNTGMQQYDYDRWGNRTNDAATWGIGLNNKQFTVNTANNRLGVPMGQSGAMTYDAAGNLTIDTYTGAGNRTYDAENKIVSAWGGNNQAQLYNYDASGQRIKRTVDGVEIWQIYGFGGELLAEYPANGAAASPQKEYGYRNGQLLVTLDSTSGVNGYSYRRAITIDHTKVPNTDQSNFPILISGTYAYLATVANGGNVQNASGYDVIFSSDSSCATKLDHEVETYSAGTGAVNYWVKVPTLSHTSDTTIYLCYGNSSITTDQSNKTGVWDANYKGVWHLSNGSTLNASDSTASGNNGTISGATASAAHDDGGASLNGTSDHIQVKAGKVDTSTTSGTVSAWVKISALDSNGVVLGYGGAAASGGALWGVYIRQISSSYYFAVAARTTNGGTYNTVKGSTALAAGTWYYVTYSTNGSSWKIRVNGATAETLTNVLGTNTGDWIGDIAPGTPDKSELGAIYCEGAYSSVNFWHGLLDEVRLSNVERSDDWMATEYNNQSSPATFYTIAGSTGTSSTSVHWLITDHLGTPRMILDQTGTLANVKRHDYLPFGEELFAPAAGRTVALGYTSGDDVRQQFTSKERDIETGLDYSGARYYASTQGRFTSPDPLYYTELRPSDPQQFNLYSYVRNSPLALLDPDGRDGYLVADSADAMDVARGQIKRMAPGTKIDANGKIHKPGFFHRVLNHLTGHGAGTSLISRIADSKNVTLIRATDKDARPAGIESSRMTDAFKQQSGCAAVGCSYYIELNTNYRGTSSDRMADDSIQQQPIDLGVALGHELVHADIFNHFGTTFSSSEDLAEHSYMQGGQKFTETYTAGEFLATGLPFTYNGPHTIPKTWDVTENRLRKELIKPPRLRATYK